MELVEYPQAEATDPKHEALLEASVAVFARYGFRKTSMDEVARAAGVSRQGLYLLFADKEELFRRAVTYQLNKQLGAAVLALANPSAPLEARLISAGDEWGGRFVGLMGGDAADLMCASTSMAGETLMHFQARFESALTQAIACSPLADSCALLGVTPSEVARTLHATIRGLKHSCKTRLEFVQGMTAAARMFCAPLASTARLGP